MNLNDCQTCQVGDGSPQTFEAKLQIRAGNPNSFELWLIETLAWLHKFIIAYESYNEND